MQKNYEVHTVVVPFLAEIVVELLSVDELELADAVALALSVLFSLLVPLADAVPLPPDAVLLPPDEVIFPELIFLLF
jgi:hypothetical protein